MNFCFPRGVGTGLFVGKREVLIVDGFLELRLLRDKKNYSSFDWI